MSRSSSGHYSEGELADSPDYTSRKKMADDEISLSLSEEDQNSDALDIKPPQPHSGYQSRERNRKRDRDRNRRVGSEWAGEQLQSYNRSRDRKSKESRYLTREERKELESRKHSESRDRNRESRKEDLRERLERERRLRKAEDRAERDERRGAEDGRRRHSKQKREKRTDRERRLNDMEEYENVQIHHRERGREERRRRRESEQYQTISSPESPSRNDHDNYVPDEEEAEKERDERNDDEEVTTSSTSESSDEGEASSTSSSSSDTEEGEASPEVSKSKSNGKHRGTPPSEVEGENEDDHEPEIKRFRSEETVVAEEEAAEVPHREEVTPTPSPVELKEELPPYLPAIMGCRSVEEFQCLNKIEEGTYGVVYRARDKKTDEIVALKRLKMEREKEGFPITSLREVSTLLKAQHPNIVTVREIVVGSNMDKIFMVMDYVEHDLKSLMETLKAKKTIFLPGEVKCLLQQLLRAVAHLHDNWILHRDLKTSNLLLSHRGVLKVGDFGLAREYGSPLKAYTSIVVTLWYRAPELLLGAKEYSTPIDVWSVGCIFGELLTMEAIFQGKFEADQINKIFRDLGTPNDTIWPGYSELPAVKKATFTNNPVSNLRKKFASRLSELGLDLLQKFLTYDPAKRITAEDALNHTYLKEHPLPIDPSIFPTWPAKSELHGPRKAQSPKPPSGGRAYKQLGDNDDDVVDTNSGFTMGNAHMDRRIGAIGAGFSLRF